MIVVDLGKWYLCCVDVVLGLGKVEGEWVLDSCWLLYMFLLIFGGRGVFG